MTELDLKALAQQHVETFLEREGAAYWTNDLTYSHLRNHLLQQTETFGRDLLARVEQHIRTQIIEADTQGVPDPHDPAWAYEEATRDALEEVAAWIARQRESVK